MSWTEVADPWTLFDAWYAEAEATEPDVPNAMQLATSDATGQPSVRTVLLKGVSPEGLCFYSNLDSLKGHELAANAKAAVVFHWKVVRRQVRARGAVQPLTEPEADAYWTTRPRGSQIAAWASQQSRPLPHAGAYDEAIAEVTARFEGQPVPRPPFWSGWRLVPSVIEFWEDGAHRMHTRVAFARDDTSEPQWTKTMLYP